MNGFFKWFKSGAKIKRWILLMLIGMVLVCYGISKVLVTDVMEFGELAKIILAQDSSVDIDEVAKSFINEEKGVNAEEDARSGALDIIAEAISDEPKYRKQIKQICYREGFITTKAAKPEEKSSYEMYYDFAEKVNRIPSHRILAINRGEKEEFLKVKIEKPTEKILELIENDIIKDRNSQYVNLLMA